jgi:hypothetical protein
VWMVRATEQVAMWYKDHVPWQVWREGSVHFCLSGNFPRKF